MIRPLQSRGIYVLTKQCLLGHVQPLLDPGSGNTQHTTLLPLHPWNWNRVAVLCERILLEDERSASLCFKYLSTYINNNYRDDYDDKGLCYSSLRLRCDYISDDKDNESHTLLITAEINLCSGGVKLKASLSKIVCVCVCVFQCASSSIIDCTMTL